MSKDGRSWCNFSFTMLDLFQISKLDGPLPEAKRRCLDRNSTLFFWVFGNIWELGNYLQIGVSFLNHKVKATILSATTEFPQPKVFNWARRQPRAWLGLIKGNEMLSHLKKKATKYCPSASFPLKYPNAEWISGPVQIRCSKPEGMK